MAAQVRLGVVGCGVIGQFHLRAAQGWPTIQLAAVADLRAEAAAATAQTFGVPKVYPDAAALLADPDIDALVLAMPTNVRTPLALAALKAGKHVLLEKPAAMNGEQLRAIIAARDASPRRPVVACCSSRHRFLKSAQVATDFLATGALGKIRLVRCRAASPAGAPPRNPPPPWRLNRSLNGGGILVNWGVYDLDYLLGLTGWKIQPLEVLAQCWTLPPQFADRAAPGSDAETHVAAMIRCADNIAITFDRGEFMTTAADNAWQIIGQSGSLRLNMLPGKGLELIHDDTTAAEGVVSRVLHRSDDDWNIIHEGPVRDFADAIVGHRPPMTSLEQALVIQRITDAIYASATSGQAVAIS